MKPDVRVIMRQIPGEHAYWPYVESIAPSTSFVETFGWPREEIPPHRMMASFEERFHAWLHSMFQC